MSEFFSGEPRPFVRLRDGRLYVRYPILRSDGSVLSWIERPLTRWERFKWYFWHGVPKR